MNKLIPQQVYYVSDESIEGAIKAKLKTTYIGANSKGVLWFESAEDSNRLVRWKFTAPIPQPEYIPWDAKTRPLGGAYRHKETGIIYFPAKIFISGLQLNVNISTWDTLLTTFEYIPDLAKEHEAVPCGVLKDEL